MAHNNTYHFNPVRGLVAGLPVSEGVPTGRNNGAVHPPHVKCGTAYIVVDNVKAPLVQAVDGVKRVMLASVRKIFPASGRSEFKALSRHENSDNIVLVHLQNFDFHVKDKFSWVEAWSGIKADGDVDFVISDSGGAILLFSQDNQEVDIYLHNGAVYRLRQEHGSIVVVPLSRKDMAELRVAQFAEQLEGLKDDDRRKEGILWGASRLLKASIFDSEVREVLADFFVGNRSKMSDKLCQEIRSLLLQVNHLSAGNFVAGYGDNVIQLRSVPSADSQKRLADVKRKKLLRQERDRQARNDMRGSSNGGGQSKKAGQKR